MKSKSSPNKPADKSRADYFTWKLEDVQIQELKRIKQAPQPKPKK